MGRTPSVASLPQIWAQLDELHPTMSCPARLGDVDFIANLYIEAIRQPLQAKFASGSRSAGITQSESNPYLQKIGLL